MKAEQTIALIFLIGGIIAGIISNYLNFFLAIAISIIIYIIFLTLAFKRIEKNKKLVNESYVTFILIWILVWITLNSL
ncbi:MAG: hypothetical protein QMD14_01075 [Candidatus Aenigmarchaeota archaeon]|nr:hypothetical protein [Candidatus Aenigmarchaeota archaeon]